MNNGASFWERDWVWRCGKAEFGYYLSCLNPKKKKKLYSIINFEVKNCCCFSLSLSHANRPPAAVANYTALNLLTYCDHWDIIPLFPLKSLHHMLRLNQKLVTQPNHQENINKEVCMYFWCLDTYNLQILTRIRNQCQHSFPESSPTPQNSSLPRTPVWH